MQGRNRDGDIENGLADTEGKERRGAAGRVASTYKYYHMQNRQRVANFFIAQRAGLVLSDDLGGGVGGGKFKREGTCAYLWLILAAIGRTQHNVVKQLSSNHE